ncbi:HNH endonuclease [Mesorhizobium sp.]|uniref:HNH endonuclease n=1 Tax=Mesorhizobium sp. TaxID=1871066 RepID=UPI0025D9D99B|nr:HNH endonuclease [Mesorhizobium sp.]
MEWRVCPSFPAYEVSEKGHVLRRRRGLRGGKVGQVMKPYVREDGYRMYILRRDNKSYHRKAHQLVAEAFIGPKPFPSAEVRHADGTRTNDHFSNLEWGTSKDNKADMVRHGTRMAGEKHHRAKLTLAQVEEIKALACTGMSQRVIGERFGVAQGCVSKIILGKRWKAA